MNKRYKIRFPISAKVIALFLLMALALILIQSILDFTYSREYIKNKLLSDMTVVANSKAVHVKTLIEEDAEDARDIAGRIVLREELERLESGASDPEMSVSRILESIGSAKEATGRTVKNADIITLDGKIAASSMPSNAGKDLSGSPFFIKGRNGLYLGDPYKVRGAFEYEISTPIFGTGEKAKEVIGVAKVQIDASRLCNILTDNAGLGDTAETILGKRDGGEMVFFGLACYRASPKFQMRIPVTSRLALPMRLATEKNTGIIIGPDYRGKEVLAAYVYIPVSGWGLVVKVDKKEAFAPIEKLLWWIIWTGGALFLLSILMIINFARFISGPLKRLREGMNEVAKGNLDHRVKVTTGDEIEEVANSFNDMTASLQTITVSYDRLNNEIEERRRAEARLAQALRAKSDFTSMVSHELRTPLAAIKEGISIILDGVVGDANKEQKEYLDIAKTNVDRLTRLINDILDFQKLESGKMELRFAEDDIAKAVQEVYDTMSPLTEKKGIGFTVKVEPGLPKIRFDRDRIIQVLTNLVNNAIKFTKKGAIAIAVIKDRNVIHIIVRDSGVGIREKDMPRLFRSFEQLEEAIERRGGTGLGLAISKEIIERHHGRIWAESEFGKGTTMHFILPMFEN